MVFRCQTSTRVGNITKEHGYSINIVKHDEEWMITNEKKFGLLMHLVVTLAAVAADATVPSSLTSINNVVNIDDTYTLGLLLDNLVKPPLIIIFV